MRSVQFTHSGAMADVLSIQEIPQPVPQSDEVLVRVMARPVNPSDTMFIMGQYRAKPAFPQTAGLEGSGVITSVGEKVHGFKPGDHVAFRAIGTWAEFIVLKPGSLISIERDIPFQLSSQVALNPVSALGLLEQSGATAGDILLLSAASSALSGLIIQLASAKGIRVIGLIRDMRQKESILKLGAFAVFSQNDPELITGINEVCGENSVSAFLDAVGGKVLTKGIKVMRPKGRIIIYGRIDPAPAELFNADIIYKDLTINGFGIAQWLDQLCEERKQNIFKLLVNDIADQKLILPDTRLFELNDFKNAIVADSNKKSGKIILMTGTPHTNRMGI